MGPKRLIVLNSIMIRGNGTNKLNGIMLYEQGPEADEMEFLVQCQNLPKGTTVALECGIPGPRPPIVLEPTVVSTFPAFTTGVVSLIPANYTGTIYLTVVAAAGQGVFSEDMSVTVQAAQPVNSGAS